MDTDWRRDGHGHIVVVEQLHVYINLKINDWCDVNQMVDMFARTCVYAVLFPAIRRLNAHNRIHAEHHRASGIGRKSFSIFD